ncbi:aminotransferase class I/II-fold pyridoxal phosphate-dependent enzyme [Teichococcus vastitatis]|uniref:aminotransferase class I/II-fold pyridoxal phosphate-dependent enzyme n=1 Tax=Teichococcus vastitatis TaxID=2307076 RepID=UPI001300610A|nr:aminotransferase class I/II-fold pyridoxal phosphate-dependent enzyme [Pseudoroseomonas vastitatis]
MPSDILGSLRALVCDSKTAPAPRVDYGRMTDFSTMPDWVSYQSMQNAFQRDKIFADYYFLPRSGRMEAEIDTPQGRKLLFSGYNYLGLANDPRVVEATQRAVQIYGSHAGAARMVGGEIDAHRELEQELAEFTGHEDAVVCVSGYGANVSVLAYLLGKKDLLVHDNLMHNSGIAGGVQSGARRMAFPHNDYDTLERILAEHRDHADRVIILVEGSYSMDGDIADLPRLLEIKRRWGCWLMVDEAHSIGTLGETGRGLAEHWSLASSGIDIVMGTLSKSFSSCGGFICGGKPMIALLRTYAPGLLLYSTGISPANTAAALAALRVLKAEPERVARLQENSRMFCVEARDRGMDIGDAAGLAPIVPVIIGHDMKGLRVASRLFEQGVLAHPILYPVVPRDSSRIRFFITAMHEPAQIHHTLDLLQKELAD